MARSGSFSKGGVAYGIPLSYVHPQDNRMPGLWDTALNAADLALTEAQKLELQDQIDDLTNSLRGEGAYL